jgi:hypothetical protein
MFLSVMFEAKPTHRETLSVIIMVRLRFRAADFAGLRN